MIYPPPSEEAHPVTDPLGKTVEETGDMTTKLAVCGRQTANLVSSEHMGQKWPYLHSSKQQIFPVIRTHLYICAFLLEKRHLIELIIGRWQRNCYRNVPLHIVKLFIYWCREQELMVRWGNSLSMTFRYANGIRQGGQLSPLLYYVYTDDLNHHHQAKGVGCYTGGAYVNSELCGLYGVTCTHSKKESIIGPPRIATIMINCVHIK